MNWKSEIPIQKYFQGVALLVLLSFCTEPGSAQDLPGRYAVPGVEIIVSDQVYIIEGNTADDLLLALRIAGGGAGLGRISYRYRWNYQTTRARNAGGVQIDDCTVDRFDIRYTATARRRVSEGIRCLPYRNR